MSCCTYFLAMKNSAIWLNLLHSLLLSDDSRFHNDLVHSPVLLLSKYRLSDRIDLGMVTFNKLKAKICTYIPSNALYIPVSVSLCLLINSKISKYCNVKKKKKKTRDNFQPNQQQKKEERKKFIESIEWCKIIYNRNFVPFLTLSFFHPYHLPSSVVYCISYQLPFIKEMHRCLDFFTLLISRSLKCVWKTPSKQKKNHITFCMCYFGLISLST